MIILLYFLIFFIGLCLGSFLNVLLVRLDKKEGIITGRSECPKCLQQLKWYDLIPLISYIILRGKCRYCRSVISPIYPITELVTALVVTLYFWSSGFYLGPSDIFAVFVLVSMIALLFFDALYLILPDKIVFMLSGTALIYGIFFKKPELINLLVSGFLFGSFFAILYIVSRGKWMGFGDVKLAFAIGLILGYPLGFFAIILAIWTAALVGVVMIVLKKASLKTALPFGSFMAGSTIIFIIFKNVIETKFSFVSNFF